MKKFAIIMSTLICAFVSTIAFSGCAIEDIFVKATDATLIEKELEEVKGEKKAISEKLAAVEEILDENGFIVVGEETEDGIVWSIVEKPEEPIEEQGEEQGEEEQNSGSEEEQGE